MKYFYCTEIVQTYTYSLNYSVALRNRQMNGRIFYHMATSKDTSSGFASLVCPAVTDNAGIPLSSSFISLSVALAIATNIPRYLAIIGRFECSIAIRSIAKIAAHSHLSLIELAMAAGVVHVLRSTATHLSLLALAMVTSE